MSEIAIATVPIQEWEKPYEQAEALWNGGMFPSLHKPFFIEKEMKRPQASLDACEADLLEIQQISFLLTELTLFLDTHPNHLEATGMKREVQQKRKELMKEFAQKHYPLTMDCEGEAEEETAPWGGGKHVAL